MIIFVYKNCEILENQGIKLQIAMTDGDLYRYSCKTHFDEMQLSKQILANICFLRIDELLLLFSLFQKMKTIQISNIRALKSVISKKLEFLNKMFINFWRSF